MPKGGLFLLLLICVPYITSAYYYDSDMESMEDPESSEADSYLQYIDALKTFKNVQKKSFSKYKRFVCRPWNNHCVPWTNRPGFKCCDGYACKCNIWMQNCRCVSRLWGR